jgi:hypothetical protein
MSCGLYLTERPIRTAFSDPRGLVMLHNERSEMHSALAARRLGSSWMAVGRPDAADVLDSIRH